MNGATGIAVGQDEWHTVSLAPDPYGLLTGPLTFDGSLMDEQFPSGAVPAPPCPRAACWKPRPASLLDSERGPQGVYRMLTRI